MKKLFLLLFLMPCLAFAADNFISFNVGEGAFNIICGGKVAPIFVDAQVNSAGKIAAANLAKDIKAVSDIAPKFVDVLPDSGAIVIATIGTPTIEKYIAKNQINGSELKGKTEKYILKVIDGNLVIAGSDRRGTVYGIYELSEQLGVSPWYWWADVPIIHRDYAAVKLGEYTDGEPAVRYRGIFLNDEAPCLTSWVKNHYDSNYGDHNFYADVFELILRLRGNFMWPAMWSWAFYADDALNSATADSMGIIMGTSHHEPMARNHQEWARNREKYGKWNYSTNQQVIDNFFREGISRINGTEDIVTIGMRGDGDEAMEQGTNVKLMEKIVANQRKIIADVTNRPPNKTPQVWALYKEVLDYYDAGMRVPDDVIMLLCDDNWGNVRRLPNEKERKHKGGWGMYYHVDYVGAPRNSKWLNCTPIQNMWEQMSLTYDYGVDKLWILNVGDLKPMEYPITLFMDLAWNPKKITLSNLKNHTVDYCTQQFGEKYAEEIARILNLYCKYAGRVTPEMLDCETYNLETGEFKEVVDEFKTLELDALRVFAKLSLQYHDAYRELILFPIQAMSNLYEMYYALAMNRASGSTSWADRVKYCYNRDAELCDAYNLDIANGKWNGMMTQKHIGYSSWNDDFEQTMPQIVCTNDSSSRYAFIPSDGYIAIEAQHYFDANDANLAKWTVIPDMGRTLSGVAVMPYNESTDNATITYLMKLPDNLDKVKVLVVTKSNLAFKNRDGHCFTIAFGDNVPVRVNTNKNLNESPENIYSVFYPTVARRVIENEVELSTVKADAEGYVNLTIHPEDPGIVFEKIVIDLGGYKKSYLFMPESASISVK
jgi:hypothetical protein